MTEPDPRQLAAAVGRLTGRKEIAQDVMSGRMPAEAIAPLFAGFVDGVIRQVLSPLVGVDEWLGFDPTQRPITGVVKLLDGSTLRITISPEGPSR